MLTLFTCVQLSLPPEMPGVFSAGYTPVSGAGSGSQKTTLARLLGSQIVAANASPCNDAALSSSVAADDDLQVIFFIGHFCHFP